MSKVVPFHSVNEFKKPPSHRVYHDNSVCAAGRDIPQHERRNGTGLFQLCGYCQRAKTSESSSPSATQQFLPAPDITTFHQFTDGGASLADRKIIAASLNQREPAHCILTVRDVTIRPDSGHVSVGDLFLTSESLVFVPRGSKGHRGDFARAAGVGVGSAGGMPAVPLILGMWMIKEQEASAFQGVLGKTLEKDQGLSIEDRIRRHGGTVNPRAAIRAVSSDDRRHLVTMTLEGHSVQILVENSPEVALTIEQWMLGQLSDDPDPLGVRLGITPPERAIRNVVRQARGETLSDKESNDPHSISAFTVEMYEEFLVLDEDTQKIALPEVLRSWDNAREIIHTRVRRDVWAQVGIILAACLLFPTGVAGFIWLVHGVQNTPPKSAGEWLGGAIIFLFVGGCCVASVGLAVDAVKKWRKCSRLRTVLDELLGQQGDLPAR